MTAAASPGDARGAPTVEYVFEPHKVQVPRLRPYLHDLWERRQFMVALAKTSLRGQRANTAMGQLWSLLDPLFQATIYFFIYAVIRGGAVDPAERIPLLVAGIFLFQYTAAALNGGGRSIIGSKSLMLNSTFPRAMLPLAEVYKGALQLFPAALIYVLFHVGFQRPVAGTLFMIPVLFALHTVMNVGIATLTATLTVFVRDVANFLTYVTRVLMFTVPIIWPVSQLDSMDPWVGQLLRVNPLFPLIVSYQDVLSGEMPDGAQLLQIAGWSAFFLVVGVRTFLRHERAFAARL